MLHNKCVIDCLNMRERTTLTRTNNITTHWWGRKGFALCLSPQAYQVWLSAMHRRSYRYLLCQDFVSGTNDLISDHPSCSKDLTDAQVLTFLNKTFPQNTPCRLWTPPQKTLCATVSIMRRKTLPCDCLRGGMPALSSTWTSGKTSANRWLWTPFFATIKTLSPFSAPLLRSTTSATLLPPVVINNPKEYKMTYGRLNRRSLHCPPGVLPE